MIDEILKSIRSQLYERAVSPLMGSFFISWAAWNYKFIMLLFSNSVITEKYRLIDEVLYVNWCQIYLSGALYPLLTALFFIYAYPIPAKYAFVYSRNRKKEISDIKKVIEEETLLTVKQSRAIKNEVYSLEQEYLQELERKNNEIEKLKENANTQEYSTERRPEVSTKENNDKITDSQLLLLKAIGKTSDKVRESMLVNNTEGGHVKAKYDLGELEKNKYVKRYHGTTEADYTYVLTRTGRAFLVANGHI